EHVDFLVQAPQREVKLDALIPRHRVVGVVVQDHDRRLHAVGPENWRVLDEARGILPDRSADTALRVLVLELARNAGSPADAVVGPDHVRDRRTGSRRAESFGLGDHVGDLISAPAVALDADGVLVDKALVYHRLNRWEHAFQRALPWVARGVDDI